MIEDRRPLPESIGALVQIASRAYRRRFRLYFGVAVAGLVLEALIAYLRPAVLGDAIRVATWLLPAEGRLRIRRRFQVRREAGDATLARAQIEYACIELSSGRPSRWPPEFRERYVPLEAVVRAEEGLPPL